jgi:CopG family nickel-responsive transcriptional regulator
MPIMRRITISVEDALAEQFDKLIQRKGYENRSEAFRDLLRGHLEQERKATYTARYCIATVSYIYDYQERELASRLAALKHDNHDICKSTMLNHLDHHNCLETVVLQGEYKTVSAVANKLIAQSGVRHGNIHIVPVTAESPSKVFRSHLHLHPNS